VGKELLTYDDLLQIVELIKSAEAFSEFHLKIGEIAAPRHNQTTAFRFAELVAPLRMKALAKIGHGPCEVQQEGLVTRERCRISKARPLERPGVVRTHKP